MKKNYFLIGAFAIMASSQAQNLSQIGADKIINTPVVITAQSSSSAKTTMAAGNDTVGWQNYNDFLPQFAPSGQYSMFGYQGGGWVYGKNHDSLNVCAAGFRNLNTSPIIIDRAVFL